ncbi:cupredoxin domain-containing protein [Kitasatospora sp. NBC_01302]|uniref:cupredoxin domain-containing protein n=1 Tax=Kitasatospora sp. NBC_01302 TaxID=2903575 RepID=UPI002E0D592F|nr:cupredoxin domain-containing protein [Kitasatospora sp. NBC_01302]
MTAVRLRCAFAGALLILALGACSSSPSASNGTGVASSTPASAGTRITIKDFQFRPADLTVHPGRSITVVNEDSTPHTVTADDKSFDTKAIGGGASATFTAPAKAGSYPYICSIHQYMHATLTVS